MTELQAMERYIQKTKIPKEISEWYCMRMSEWYDLRCISA